MAQPLPTVRLIPADPAPEGHAAEPWAGLSPFQQRLARQICEALGAREGHSAAAVGLHVDAAIAALREIAPRSELEGMLVVQMVLTHHAAVAAFRPGVSGAGRERSRRQEHHWMTLFLQQLERLDRHRSRTMPAPAPAPDLLSALEQCHAEFDEFLEEFLDERFSRSASPEPDATD